MKKIISLFLAAVTLFCTLTFGFTASAAYSQLYLQREQYNAQKSYSGFYGKKLYYFDNDGKKLYIKSGLNGKPQLIRDKISCGGSSSMYKSYVYYIGSNGVLYRCNIKTKKRTAVVKKAYIADFIIADGMLVYRAEDPFGEFGVEGLYICKLNGKKKKRITKDYVGEYYSYKSCVYFVELSKHKLKRYNIKKKKVQKVKLAKKINKMTLIGMENRYLYFHRAYKAKDVFYKVDFKTGVFTKIGESRDNDTVGQDFEYLVSNGKVYFAKDTGATVTYCVLNNTTKKFDPICKADRSTVTYPTYMQFYKDYLVEIKCKDDLPIFEFISITDLKAKTAPQQNTTTTTTTTTKPSETNAAPSRVAA